MMWSGQDFPNITIDDGKIGIGGTFTPAFELEIRGETNPAARIRATGNAGSDHAALHIVSKSGSAQILMGDEADMDAGYIVYNQLDAMIIGVSGANQLRIDDGFLRPMVDGDIDLGSASLRFDDVYAVNGTIQTSDVNDKKDVQDFPDGFGTAFIKAVAPRLFRWKDGNRLHSGFIAQEMETALNAIGFSPDDFGAFIQAPEEEGSRKGLRYTELIAVLALAIQELEARVTAAEA